MIHYRPLRILGQGGFGIALLCERTEVGGIHASRRVVVKLARRGVQPTIFAEEHLEDEARLLGRLQLEGVVRVLGLTRVDGREGIVLDYVPGVSLRVVLDGERPPPRAAAEILLKVCAIAAATYGARDPATGEPLHVVHRDLSPANIILSHLGSITLVDFGLASARFPGRRAAPLLYAGTRGIASPEQLGGEAPDPAADVYALGALTESLLGPAHPPVRALYLGMMEERPERRPSLSEVLTALEALLPSLPGPSTMLVSWAATAIPRFEEEARRVAELRHHQEGGALPEPWTDAGAPVAPATSVALPASSVRGGVPPGNRGDPLPPSRWTLMTLAFLLGLLAPTALGAALEGIPHGALRVFAARMDQRPPPPIRVWALPAVAEGWNDREALARAVEACATRGPAAIAVDVPQDHPLPEGHVELPQMLAEAVTRGTPVGSTQPRLLLGLRSRPRPGAWESLPPGTSVSDMGVVWMDSEGSALTNAAVRVETWFPAEPGGAEKACLPALGFRLAQAQAGRSLPAYAQVVGQRRYPWVPFSLSMTLDGTASPFLAADAEHACLPGGGAILAYADWLTTGEDLHRITAVPGDVPGPLLHAAVADSVLRPAPMALSALVVARWDAPEDHASCLFTGAVGGEPDLRLRELVGWTRVAVQVAWLASFGAGWLRWTGWRRGMGVACYGLAALGAATVGCLLPVAVPVGMAGLLALSRRLDHPLDRCLGRVLGSLAGRRFAA